ncbi:GDP-D-glucose phosphorylase 1 [Scaptodrosophila lebanonensis]|uniref:GDP-D-glucose phosphorylase 1 n=1 Tax=Drosophila lebanonensis TaxID=7225 RepID=A0A6J2UB67_DROLE|nr:GDP-D-glucose phosphorylase 1 [Scaptodrosophila lebanonensis]
MTLEKRAQEYLDSLKMVWMQLHSMPGVFSYELNATKARVLSGKCNFYAELNKDRSMKRRLPQTIENLNPKFKPSHFNFNKVNTIEQLMIIEHNDRQVHMIVNKSPITQYHTLICPDVKKNLVQKITAESLLFCITFMRHINDGNIRIGYNSPGALASVNHLHYHLVHMPQDLYIDKVELEHLADGYTYRLSSKLPTEAVCFVFNSNDTKALVREKVENIHRLTEWMCDQNLPHNLFITHDRRDLNKPGKVLVYVFARSKFCVTKDLAHFNVGFCELAGYIPLGDDTKLQSLTEKMVVERVRDISGDAYKSVYGKVKFIVNNSPTALIWEQPFTI